MDWRVVLYAFLLSLGTGILCGVGPAIVGSRPVLQTCSRVKATDTARAEMDLTESAGGAADIALPGVALHYGSNFA